MITLTGLVLDVIPEKKGVNRSGETYTSSPKAQILSRADGQDAEIYKVSVNYEEFKGLKDKNVQLVVRPSAYTARSGDAVVSMRVLDNYKVQVV